MRFIKATTLFNGKEKLSADSVLVMDDNGQLKEIVPETQVEKGNTEQLEGTLTPGFVNAHCHLELSHMKDLVPRHTGLPGFAKHIITQRNSSSAEEMALRMQDADKAMWQNGIVAVGDISNNSDSFALKKQSPVFYHTFIELLGLNPANHSGIFDKGLELLKHLQQYELTGSLAPHAPYSTSTALIEKISAHAAKAGLPLSIHNQESEDETKFFNGSANGFDDLYKFLGLDTSWFQSPGTSSLQAYAPFLPEKAPSLLVHNTFTDQSDIEAANSKNSYWCFCPGANQYIENRLPAFNLFRNMTDKICIGTDSLASNAQLDLMAEINIILKHSEVFSPEQLLRAITANAAEALGISDRFGSFIIGKNAGLNLVDIKDSQIRFLKKIA